MPYRLAIPHRLHMYCIKKICILQAYVSLHVHKSNILLVLLNLPQNCGQCHDMTTKQLNKQKTTNEIVTL